MLLSKRLLWGIYFINLIYEKVFCQQVPCAARSYGQSSIICVCNATYCDTVEPESRLPQGYANMFISTLAGQRLEKSSISFTHQPSKTAQVTLEVKPQSVYQTMLGFGGAFTDATGINILSLSLPAQYHLIQSYFGSMGLEYTLGRIPMASCDFSTHLYSYDDSPGDLGLANFTLAMEDLKYKIPIIQKAQSISRHKISLFGSPWSAPAWMKTSQNMTGYGTLIGNPGGPYYKAWANYFVRFLEEYRKYNITLWGLTAQNEPTDGYIHNFPFQAMGWYPDQQKDFIALDLGPAMKAGGFSDVKLMILDDTRLNLPYWAEKVFSQQSNASMYVSGIAVHWYEDFIAPTLSLDVTHKEYPDKFILATEACITGNFPSKVSLGNWENAEKYAHSIIEDASHWVTGWSDWNLALDMEGGPNWVKNFVDSPIIVNAKADEFYKQPMFYAMGHFSKFVTPGSQRIEMLQDTSVEDFESIAFQRPDGSFAVVILNRGTSPVLTAIHDPLVGYLNRTVPPRSLITFTWWR
ncbi:hypothetical protein ACJMK2_044121 [Sinanodonta woodiana]|uniref:Glucosylceramidase n=1 Tax=Sinanodonta woodiana TaxID=1069815 RepID=A0ABD3W0V3_SINWO